MGRVNNRIKQFVRRLVPLDAFHGHIFIVGAQKAGTSALHKYLKSHPRLIAGDNKEAGYFSRDELYAKGDKYYRALFSLRAKHAYALDSTPEYVYYSRCADRIHRFAPGAKIVILLREPIARAFSAFNMYQQIFQQDWFKRRIKVANSDARDFFVPILEGTVKPDLSYFLDRETGIINTGGTAEEPSLIRRGIYAPQLERFIRLFGKKNVLILFSIELKNEPHKTVNKVLAFAGLEPLNSSDYPQVHAREYTVDQNGRELIKEYAAHWFEIDKTKLVGTYGLDVPW